MNETDLELLARYNRQHAEDAFAELVRRYLELVFTAAVRQVRSTQLAEEVAQSVFSDLAGQAHRFAPDTILSAWLYQVTRRTAIDVVRREARRQRREQVATELSAMNTSDADWTRIEPLLDEAMDTLEEADRAAVVLRYFENKPLREVGQALGASEEAARKRVSRAVDRLREYFSKRGVAASAGGLAAAISANAVQGAPVGLSASIATAAVAGAGATTAATALSTATKVIAMTTLQKTVIGATLVAAIGAGIYEARQASRLRQENQNLQQQQRPLSEQVVQLQRERDESAQWLVAAQEELARLRSNSSNAEVLKLRGLTGSLQQRLAASEAQSNTPGPGMAKLMNAPGMKEYIRQAMLEKFRSMYEVLFQELKLTPDQAQKVVELMGDRASKALATLSAPPGSAEHAAASQANAESDRQVAAEMRSMLGETGYERFKDYSLEIPARTTLALLKPRLGDAQLSEEQSTRLLQVIKAEPQELTQGIIGGPDKAFGGSQAEIDHFLQQVTESNQRILQQAAGFLTPDQLNGLNAVLTNGIEARKAQGAAFMQRR
jgi:RNA polymerase sigma factor (sigma-70 family)